ncbi:unnamed protein product [Hapterophycus canaliculatus]
MKRHHCRGCKKAMCDPCSKERLQLVGGDSKRHRVCHPCLKQHLAEGRTREDRLMPSAAPSSLRSSPFESQDTSRNVSREPSRHGSVNITAAKGLATYVEDQEHPQPPPPPAAAGREETKATASDADQAAEEAAATAVAMAAAWSGGSVSAEISGAETAAAAGAAVAGATAAAAGASGEETTPPADAVLSIPHELHGAQDAAAEEEGGVAVATAVGVAVGVRALANGEVATGAGRQSRLPLGTGVATDPASHQHKRPVS